MGILIQKNEYIVIDGSEYATYQSLHSAFEDILANNKYTSRLTVVGHERNWGFGGVVSDSLYLGWLTPNYQWVNEIGWLYNTRLTPYAATQITPERQLSLLSLAELAALTTQGLATLDL